MKKITLYLALFCLTITYAQDNQGYFSGGLESNMQWLQNDDGLMFLTPEDQFRANNYVQLNYTYGKFSAGLQYESYLPSALLGYAPNLDGNNGIATYYVNFKNDQIDVTGGFFYEQFGSGLILRNWEDRQLGINNAMRGVRVKFTPTNNLDITGVYGQIRNAFELSAGVVQGLDANFDLGDALGLEGTGVTLGASYVGRFQDREANDSIPSNVPAYAARLGVEVDNFFGNVEAVFKGDDVIANEGQLSSNQVYSGSALLLNLGYAKSGLGVNAMFRRLENFSFYADRLAEGNVFNQELINYVPALTKQQDYLLTNIYVYNPQPRLVIETFEQRAGEIGTQFDVYYSFKKGTTLGGKYGTKIAANFSYWGGLDATFDIPNRTYDASFVGSGARFFRDFNLEIKKRWSSSWSSVLTYQNVIVDKGVTLGGPLGVQGDIKAQVIVGEATYRIKGSQSVRLALQHLSTKEDRKNWAGGVLEYNFNSNFAVYAADSWNYGGEGEIHYYNFGGSYTKSRMRFAINYGRQRGGLICIGGVCRFVPENTGLSANLTVTF